MNRTINWRISLLVLIVFLVVAARESRSQTKPTPVRVAYSALSAGIGVLWLTHEQGIFRKHDLESNLVYMRSGTTAAQALLAGEIQFGHLSPAPMMTAWAQGADIAWVGTTIHQMVFTLITDATITKAADLKGKKLGITRIGSASDLALRTALEHLGVGIRDVAVISMGGIPDILAGMRAGAVNGGILSPPTSTAARELGYRPLVHIPDLGKEFTFSGIAAKGLLFKVRPISSKALWQHLPTVRKSTKKTIVPRSGFYENTCAPTTEHSKRATKNTTPPFLARRIRALKR